MKSFSPGSDIFRWVSKIQSPVKSTTEEDEMYSTRGNVKSKLVKKVCSFKPEGQTTNLRWLQSFLLNCGQKKKRKRKPSKSSPVKSSLERKLDISEIKCARKSSIKSSAAKPPKIVSPSFHNQSNRNMKAQPHADSQERFVLFWFIRQGQV